MSGAFLGWETRAEPEHQAPAGRKFALQFDGHGTWRWFGRAADMRAAESKARAELARIYSTFDTSAVLTAAEETR